MYILQLTCLSLSDGVKPLLPQMKRGLKPPQQLLINGDSKSNHLVFLLILFRLQLTCTFLLLI